MGSLADEILMHYGMPRRSGRYPWGSGDDPYQHSTSFLSRVDDMRAKNVTYTDPKTGKTYTGDTAIAKKLGLTSSQFRTEISLANDEIKLYKYKTFKSLQEDGLSPTEIGRKTGFNESTVRSVLANESYEAKTKKARETADFIKEQIEKKGMIDIGVGVERELNISKEKLNQALYLLEREGYPVYNGRFEQPTNRGQWTTQKVICPKGTPYKDIYNLEDIHPLNEDNYISRDGGKTFEKKFHYPESMDSSRLKIRYAEEGGIDKDGIVELRRGVQDLSLGESNYSQVRILVDGTHYIKGMAVYSDDMPDGVDVVFNTNKKQGTPTAKVLKEIKKDPDNPFGSLIKDAEQGGQYWYTDKKTGEKKLGLINKRADEGDWDEWADALPSQFLGKQSKYMAKKQLDLAKADKQNEFDEICELTNPTVKKHLLEKFADECDGAAVHLKAAALPGQKYHVIIPINTLKENEVYAPGYEPGTKLALIRYPHGGTFEIPILTVNNKNELGQKVIGKQSIDAIGINKKIADQLSGADFDGDTVMCIPTHDKAGKVKITSRPPLKDLEGFDPKDEYGGRVEVDKYGVKHAYDANGREYKIMKATQLEMGKISNLITDMTLAGAPDAKLAAAVRHSMVVIDAEKHGLDYRKSEIDHNIAALRKEYQPKYDADGNVVGGGGAHTILSRAKGELSVNKRQGTPKTNIKGKEWYDPTKPEGSLIYKDADDLYYPIRKRKDGIITLTTTDGKKIKYDETDKEAAEKYTPVPVKKGSQIVGYTNKAGDITYKVGTRQQQSTRMAETDDAYSLVSGERHAMEMIYADYANSMKSLANKARLEVANTGKIAYNKNAKTVYQDEVDSLNKKLNEAEVNATRERAATRMATAEVNAKAKSDPSMKKSDIKKASQMAVNKYRQEYGSVSRKDRSIIITDREWEAIQAGAVSETTLKKILKNTDVDNLRERATPRSSVQLNQSKINRIKAMSSSNYTVAEIAKKLGVSTSTVSKYL